MYRYSFLLLSFAFVGLHQACSPPKSDAERFRWLQDNNTGTLRLRTYTGGQHQIGLDNHPSLEKNSHSPTTLDTLRSFGDSSDVMTIDYARRSISTTVQLSSARTFKVDEVRLTEQGLTRLLRCADGTIRQCLFVPSNPKRELQWAFQGCEGDTISTFTIPSADTTILIPAGRFAAVVVREIDNTGIMTDTYINAQRGIVKVDYLRAQLQGHRYVNNPRATPVETFELHPNPPQTSQ
jgi:hypothetical protein